MRKAVAVLTTLLILSALLSSIQPIQIVKANPYMAPKFTVQSPQNNTVIYGTNTANISLTLETSFVYNYYYTLDAPIVLDKTDGKTPVNPTILSETPIIQNEHVNISDRIYQWNMQLLNLANGQHSLTLYYSYTDYLITSWVHIIPMATINFSVDSNITPSPSPNPTPTATPYLPLNRNAPHLDPIFYLIPIGIILAIVILAIIIYRRKRISK